jgi:hypothetical protein
VDVAVLETARGGILRAGLGFDEADVGVGARTCRATTSACAASTRSSSWRT